MFDEEAPYDPRFDDDDAQFGALFGADAEHRGASGGAAGFPPVGPPLGPDHIPPRPGVSLIDAGLGAGYLASRLAAGPARAVARAGQRLAPSARRALHTPATHGLTDLSEWVLRTLAQVGAPQRSRAEQRLRMLARAATGAVAANRDVGRLVHDVASRQVGPLIDEALPIVLDRLDEQPEQVRKIVQGQSRGMMTEARDTARTGARRGDDMVDSVVDRLLRRRAAAPAAQPASAQPASAQTATAPAPASAPPPPPPAAPTTPVQAVPVGTAPAPKGPAQPRGPGR